MQIVQLHVLSSCSQQKRFRPPQPVIPAQPQKPPRHCCGNVQLVPQPPQLPLAKSEVSHPLAGLTSQSAKLATHDAIWHEPAPQVTLAFARAQVAPHEPQLASELSGVSQPLAALPSQLPNPALQAPSVHAPALQLAVALAREHPTAQPPQLLRVLRGVSHPLASAASQLPEPALQLPITQLPPAHVGVALARAHALPQDPQLPGVLRGVSQPLAALPSQLPQPLSQPPIAQLPAKQAGVACARVHALPQRSQLLTLESEVSHPSAASPLQSPNPILHAVRHIEATHVFEPFARGGHPSPQAPQLFGSTVVSTQLAPQRISPALHPEAHITARASQNGVAPPQASLQRAQFCPVPREVSQPLASLPSQFA